VISKSKARLVRRLTIRRMREREGLALAEGPRVVREALRSSLETRWVLLGEEYAGQRESGQRVLAACRERGVEVLSAPDREVAGLASTERPQPVIGCVAVPPPQPKPVGRGRYLMPVGIQVPGNLGTLIRSAWGFGLDGIVIGPGTVDPWNPKVVRASAGGVFHLPMISGPALGDGPGQSGPGQRAPAGERAGARERRDSHGDAGSIDLFQGINLLCADAAGEPLDVSGRGVPRDWVLALGHETGGLPARLVRRARAIAIPMAAGVDSLNVAVAGSILLYLLTRRGE